MTLTRAVGIRPAALEKAALEMFHKAKWNDDKRKKVMLVSSHKREEDGPAAIPMSPEIKYLIKIFINKLHPLVTDETSPKCKIFLKNDGTPFQKEGNNQPKSASFCGKIRHLAGQSHLSH